MATEVQADDPKPVFKTVANVEIVSTGTYHLGANAFDHDETTFTVEDLADAVAALDDPAIQPPRLKLGHTSEWGDAEPSFGKVLNLRTAEEGQTILGDYTGVPAWLAEVLPVVYPNRSIEAFFNVTTPTGNTYRMVITAVALLGVTLPGVATLEDLAGLYSEEMPEGVEVDGEFVEAQVQDQEVNVGLFNRKKKAAASTNLEDLRRAFYENVATGDQAWWWIRELYVDPNELIADSDDGELFRMTWNIKGEDVAFGEPEPVKIEYVAAASDEDEPTRGSLPVDAGAAVYASRSESRPETDQPEEDQVDGEALRTKLGLPKDATEDEVNAKLSELTAETPPAEEPNGDDGDGEDEGTDEPEPEPSEQTEEPAAVAGTVTMDSAGVAQLRRDAELGRKAHDKQVAAERESVLASAYEEGKFPPARLDHYRKAFAADPEGTKALIDNLEPGLVPVEARGGAEPEAQGSSDAYPREWLNADERARSEGKVTAAAGTVTREEV